MSTNNNINNGIFINQISESQPELQQPSIKRQRIEGDSETASSTSQPPPQSLAFLDDSGNSTSSSSSSPSPVNESENISSRPEEPLEKEEENDKECLQTFQTQLTQHQCLCGLSDRTLEIPFRYYSRPDSDSKQVKSLKDWPEDFLLKFLSNLQLLFHIYLKQNAKGNICGKIMDLCSELICNKIHVFEELIELCNSPSNDSSFVSYVASKIITYFLIIIKEEIDHERLNRIVDNLFMSESMDFIAVKRINFSLDIIKCIVEWKDHDEHILEEESSSFSPPLENNYFALHHDGPSTSSSALPSYLTSQSGRSSATSGHNSPVSNGCYFVPLTDSESFDTAHIKQITTKILANKWPELVAKICSLITQISTSSRSSVSFNSAENCILTFIALWESIISVRTNLSVMETAPFMKNLVDLEWRLNQNLPCVIYKQILQLFNEALCYGSTLALQDSLPEETCEFAHLIINHVKENRILESMPRQMSSTSDSDDNLKALVGLNCETVVFPSNSLDAQCPASISTHTMVKFDKSLLQKMTLLVLKSVAVSVKNIRADSSDSSVGSSSVESTDDEAIEEMKKIERTMRDVLKKLESFIKVTLEFLPESHFSKILIHLFDDQDDFLIEAMVCTLDVTSGISIQRNTFPELVAMLNPVFTFLEFLKMIYNSNELLLDLLVSSETCFLLYLLRFLKYIRHNWPMFVESCRIFGGNGNNTRTLDATMGVLTSLRYRISNLVTQMLFPYEIAPILRLIENCESLHANDPL